MLAQASPIRAGHGPGRPKRATNQEKPAHRRTNSCGRRPLYPDADQYNSKIDPHAKPVRNAGLTSNMSRLDLRNLPIHREAGRVSPRSPWVAEPCPAWGRGEQQVWMRNNAAELRAATREGGRFQRSASLGWVLAAIVLAARRCENGSWFGGGDNWTCGFKPVGALPDRPWPCPGFSARRARRPMRTSPGASVSPGRSTRDPPIPT